MEDEEEGLGCEGLVAGLRAKMCCKVCAVMAFAADHCSAEMDVIGADGL